jgi:carboxyl-terminal processing protease
VVCVRDTYVYADFNGVDWDGVYSRYEAKIEAGLEDEAFYAAMREMIDELGDEHSAYYSPQEVIEEDALLSGQLDYVGIGIYVTTMVDKGYAVLLQVFPGSPGERAGLRSHDRILAVDGLPVVDQVGWENLDRIEGPSGTAVRLLVQTPGEEAREVLVTRERIQAQHPVEAHRIPNTDVGYVLIPTFWDQTIAARVRQALNELMAVSERDGLILDMRINGGGLVSVLEDTLSLFVEGDLGEFVSRAEERPLRIHADPVGDSLTIPLVVLIGRETVSFGEIFSGLLHEMCRARLVGRTTDGNVEILWPVDFEDGSLAWIASETFRPPSGADWEDTGIAPDVDIPLDWDEFTFQTDVQLQAAVELLLSAVPK